MTIETATGAIQAFAAVFSYTVQVRLKQPSDIMMIHHFREAAKWSFLSLDGHLNGHLDGQNFEFQNEMRVLDGH